VLQLIGVGARNWGGERGLRLKHIESESALLNRNHTRKKRQMSLNNKEVTQSGNLRRKGGNEEKITIKGPITSIPIEGPKEGGYTRGGSGRFLV